MGSTTQASGKTFQDLFSSSTKDYVHYVDTVYEYTDVQKFTDMLAFKSYLNTYTNPKLSKVDNNVVKARIQKTDVPKSPSITWESWQKDTVEITYEKPTQPIFTSTPTRLVQEIRTSVEGVKVDTVKTSHTTANIYMDQVMFAIGKWKYTDFKQKLVDNYNISNNANNINTNIKTAISRINDMVGQTQSAVLSELKKVCTDALDFWVKDKPTELFLLTGLVDGAAFKDTMIRNALRDIMYKNLYLQSINEPNDAVLQYMKRILADMFIVCFYPYIHFLYATQLQNYFIKRGDFINMRVATSAKIMIVINSISAIVDMASGANSIAPTTQQLTSAEITQLTDIVSVLNAYYDNLGNPIFDEPSKKYGDVDIEVRELAKDVYDMNLTIDELKKWIKDTQLQIRSHNTIYKGIDGALQNKKIQYSMHIVFIIILLIVVGVLLKLNMYLDITMYVLAFIIVFFIMVRLISIIISLL